MILISLIGLVSGFVVGTIAAGWGAISVPALILIGIHPILAIQLTLLAAVLVSLAGGLIHLRYDNVRKKVFLPLVLTGLFGSVVGSVISINLLSQKTLEVLIGLTTLIMGIVVIFQPHVHEHENKKTLKVILVGLLAGFLSGAFGTGWGPTGVSMLMLLGINPHTVIGSSLFARVCVTLSGGLSYFIQLKKIYLAVFLPLTISGVIGSFIGAEVANNLHAKQLKKAFGVIMSLLGLLVVIKVCLR